MIRPILALVFLSAPLAAAHVANDRPHPPAGPEEACVKDCDGAYESSVLGCKLFKTPDESKDCLDLAQDKKARCARECRTEKAAKEVEPEGKWQTGPREGKQPETLPAR